LGVDGRTDGRTHITKLILTFLYFANALNPLFLFIAKVCLSRFQIIGSMFSESVTSCVKCYKSGSKESTCVPVTVGRAHCQFLRFKFLTNFKYNDLYSSPYILWVIKSRSMRWAGHVACMGTGEAYAGF